VPGEDPQPGENGLTAKPSREVRVGDLIEIQYAGKTLVVEVGEVPSGQVPRKQAAGYYRVVREAAGDEAGDRRF
jgi:ribosomal 50S subunit-recycling heat shock protein